MIPDHRPTEPCPDCGAAPMHLRLQAFSQPMDRALYRCTKCLGDSIWLIEQKRWVEKLNGNAPQHKE